MRGNYDDDNIHKTFIFQCKSNFQIPTNNDTSKSKSKSEQPNKQTCKYATQTRVKSNTSTTLTTWQLSTMRRGSCSTTEHSRERAVRRGRGLSWGTEIQTETFTTTMIRGTTRHWRANWRS